MEQPVVHIPNGSFPPRDKSHDAPGVDDATFNWVTHDVRPAMPSDWFESIMAVADTAAEQRVLVPRSVTSRESDRDARLPMLSVGADVLSARLPWLDSLYRGLFLELAQRFTDEQVVLASDPRHAISINVKRGTKMRYECHVDSNPIEGLLYVTEHPPGTGGELRVSNRGDVASCELVDEDYSVIFPAQGHLVLFDGSRHSHYVTPLVDRNGVRVAVAMNFYTPSLTEAERPPDLDQHLLGI